MNAIRNFLVLGLIVASLPTIAAPKANKPATQKPQEKQADLNEALLRAAGQNDIDRVKDLLARGADANAKTETGETALMKSSDVEISKLLIAAGADVNALTEWNESALIFQAYLCRETICKLLIEAGADVNIKTSWGETALDLVGSHIHYLYAGDSEESRQAWIAQEKIETESKTRQLLMAHGAISGEISPAKNIPTKHRITRWARLKARVLKFFKRS